MKKKIEDSMDGDQIHHVEQSSPHHEKISVALFLTPFHNTPSLRHCASLRSPQRFLASGSLLFLLTPLHYSSLPCVHASRSTAIFLRSICDLPSSTSCFAKLRLFPAKELLCLDTIKQKVARWAT
ncbi:hypothetical protein PIB30_044990 [Stylosanthes scabra]|uniref:Uncharacterized protein n=1 Tax=Stylosanthes scabra TaxID=79078 RepID=A0ABU6WFY7_9FABA|nr:hypothetical protein [Stylosanthes scabra]